MEREVGKFFVKDIVFGAKTRFDNGVLQDDREEGLETEVTEQTVFPVNFRHIFLRQRSCMV